MDGLDQAVVHGFLVLRRFECSPATLAFFIKTVATRPDDGRAWLTLGRLLEMGGAREESLVAYETGLGRMAALDLGKEEPLTWSGLARALHLLPGHRVVEEWPAWMKGSGRMRALAGLSHGLGDDEPELYQRILGRGLTVEATRAPCAIYLYRFLVERQRRPEAGLEVLRSAVRAVPDFPPLVFALVGHFLARGRLTEARAALGAHLPEGDRAHLTRLIDGLAAPPGLVPGRGELKSTSLSDGGYFQQLLARSLEGGGVAVAEELVAWATSLPVTTATQRESFEAFTSDVVASSSPWSPLFDRGRLMLDLVGAGARKATREATCRSLLVESRPAVDEWNRAAGALASETGAALFDGWWHEASRRQGESASLGLSRALWLGRLNRVQESLVALARARELHDRPVPSGPNRPAAELAPAAVFEIVGRPLLRHRLGFALSKELLDALSRDVGPGGPLVDDLFESVVRGDLKGAAATAARLFDLEPGEPIWGLTWVWCSGGTPALRAQVRAALRQVPGGQWALRELERPLPAGPVSVPPGGSARSPAPAR
ncbi:MAG: hypothetical protein HY815_18150 [Candidatus Riflebacteria bacterium]|nr:hypothetical protein [Candidatus Riflebacteria bacterium]